MTSESEALFSARLCELLHGEFSIRYSYPESIAPSSGGKFEDFLSLVMGSS